MKKRACRRTLSLAAIALWALILGVLSSIGQAQAQITVTGSDLTSSGPHGGAFTPLSTDYTVSGLSAVPDPFTASADQPWVTVSPTSGTASIGSPATVTVSINSNANTLPPATHTATLTFSSTAGGGGTRTVTLTVQGPQMQVAPDTAFEPSGVQGGPFSPASKAYEVTNIGNQRLDVTVTANQTWINLSDNSNTWGSGQSLAGFLDPTKSATITVALNAAANALAAGTHTATVTFTNTNNGVGTTTRTVTLTVQVPPTLAVTPAGGLTSTGLVGGPFSPSSVVYTLTNPGVAPMNWTAASNQTWVAPSALSGTLAAGASTTVTVALGAGANALAAGAHNATITFTNTTNGIGTTTRPVTLTVQPLGTLAVTPATGLTSSGAVGGPFSPASQSYTLTNTGAASLNWTAASNQAWVAPATLSGTLAPGASTSVAVTLGVGANALAGGTHNATITFTNTTNGNGNTTRPVALTVLVPGPLVVTPATTATFSGRQGGPFTPITRSYTLTNSGTAPINYTSSANQSWIGFQVGNAGTLEAGASTDVTFFINTFGGNLSPNTWNATLTFNNTTNNSGSTTRPVVLTVLPPPVLQVTPADDQFLSGPRGGPFPNGSYTLSNPSSFDLQWSSQVTGFSTGLSLSPSSGTLAPGASVTVTTSYGAAANSLPVGVAENTILFNNLSNSVGGAGRRLLLDVQPTCQDAFAQADLLPLSFSVTLFDTSAATGEPGEPEHAGASGTLNSRWCKLVSNTNQRYSIDTQGSAFDTTLAVYTGTAVNALTLVASNNDISASNKASRVVFDAVAGTTYYIAIDGVGTAKGSAMLNVGQVFLSPFLTAAVLPYARSVAVGTPATAFGTIINTSTSNATGCSIGAPLGFPGAFQYRPTNAQNEPIGQLNTPIDIPAGASQGFVFGLTPTQVMNATEVRLVFICTNLSVAGSIPGVNTLLLSAAPATADLIAIGATVTGDGIVNIPGANGIGFFSSAAVNIASAGTMTATADDGGRGLPVTLSLCETNASGACVNPPAPAASVSFSMASNQVRTFSVFVAGTGTVPFDPANNRIFLRFNDASGVTRGATTVAVRTQ